MDEGTKQFTIWNHWVPQWYLKRWSSDGKSIAVYETLVPHANYPVWENRAVRGLAAAEHLYTSTNNSAEPDAFERYLKEEIEEPALSALENAIAGKPLSRCDHDRITYYAVALDQRTPSAFLEHAKRWHDQLPDMITSSLSGSIKKLEKLRKKGKPFPNAPPAQSKFPSKVVIKPNEQGGGDVELHVTVGRELWLWTMRHALTVTAPNLIKTGGLVWSIIEPRPDTEWFTSDHPLLRVNYYGLGKFDFGGGWGNKNSELALPLSPSALLYSKVGSAFPSRLQMGRQESLTLQTLLALRAFHAIYARTPWRRIEFLRPRLIDSAGFNEYHRQLREWHDQNVKAESNKNDSRKHG